MIFCKRILTKNKTLVILLFFACTFSVFGQNSTDPILVKKELGTMYIQKGRLLKAKELVLVMQNNSEALLYMEKAKANYDFSSVFGFAGGFLVGWPLGSLVFNGEANLTMLGIGVGLIAISIPLTVKYHKHTKKAIEIYNAGLEQAGSNNIQFKINSSGNSIGFSMLF